MASSSRSITYKTTIEGSSQGEPFFFRTNIPLSDADGAIIHRGSFQERVKVLQNVVDTVRPQLLGAKPWTCRQCKSQPASQVIGECCNLEFPREEEDDRYPPTLIHYNPSLVCSSPVCIQRACTEDRLYCKQFKRDAKGEMKVRTAFFCKHCGKTESVDGPKMKRCARCRFVWYCNKECQTADWNEHKKKCIPVQGDTKP